MEIPLGDSLLSVRVPHCVSVSKVWTVVSGMGGWGLVDTALSVPAGVGVAGTIMRLFVYIIISFVYGLLGLYLLFATPFCLVYVAVAAFVFVVGIVGVLAIVWAL